MPGLIKCYGCGAQYMDECQLEDDGSCECGHQVLEGDN